MGPEHSAGTREPRGEWHGADAEDHPMMQILDEGAVRAEQEVKAVGDALEIGYDVTARERGGGDFLPGGGIGLALREREVAVHLGLFESDQALAGAL